MKIILIFLCLFLNLYAGVMELSSDETNEMVEQRSKFFTQIFLVRYDKTKISLDDQQLHYIDLCKYQPDGYQFPCGYK